MEAIPGRNIKGNETVLALDPRVENELAAILHITEAADQSRTDLHLKEARKSQDQEAWRRNQEGH